MEKASSYAVEELIYCIGTGKRHAKTSRQLAWLMDISERRVRMLIEQARHDGYLIFAYGDGYFIPDFTRPEEHTMFKRFLAREKRKAETHLANVCLMEQLYEENDYAF